MTLSSTLLLALGFLLVLALIPLGLKWLQQRMGVVGGSAAHSTRVISAVAVGPHQRVVTVEAGPPGARVWLTLGVTAQSVTCLHTAVLGDAPDAPLLGARSPLEPS